MVRLFIQSHNFLTSIALFVKEFATGEQISHAIYFFFFFRILIDFTIFINILPCTCIIDGLFKHLLFFFFLQFCLILMVTYLLKQMVAWINNGRRLFPPLHNDLFFSFFFCILHSGYVIVLIWSFIYAFYNFSTDMQCSCCGTISKCDTYYSLFSVPQHLERS